MKRFLRYRCPALVLLLLLLGEVEGQVTLSGPTCVVPGTVYQYVISGSWDSSASMQVRMAGGYLADTSKGKVSTVLGRFSRQLLVVWNDSVSPTRSLSLTSPAGNSGLTVTFTPPLHPGVIDSICISQLVGLDSIPGVPITCSLPFGGACSPDYRFQWQQSHDRMHWKDIPSATGRDLQIKSPIRQSIYFRRKVTEASTGSIGYSGQAAVFLRVDAVLPDSTLKAITDSANATSAIAVPGEKVQHSFVGQPLNRNSLFFTKPKEEPFHA